ncbi:hypothetical protein, partial [Salmonella enterica]|uniref:hypothetical protein n=1 Tax=Salmonella enterica TaxID=28901 RepID=UPI000CBBB098
TKNVQLEKGDVATDWTPAPEDTADRITALSNDFEVTAEGITQDLNAFKQTANGQFSDLNTQIETVAGEQTRQYEELTGELNNKLENSDLNSYATESYVNTEITEGVDGVTTRIESVESTQDS